MNQCQVQCWAHQKCLVNRCPYSGTPQVVSYDSYLGTCLPVGHEGVCKCPQPGRGSVVLPAHLLPLPSSHQHDPHRAPCRPGAQPASAELPRTEQGSSGSLYGEPRAEGGQGGTCRSPSCLSLQFRENVQDVLPALPNPDDYFLLRWLRGEGRGAAAGRLGQRLALGHRNGDLGEPCPWRAQDLEDSTFRTERVLGS